MSTVSTIIPTYNYARFLGEALDSIVAQSLKPGEVIVVDDGSTDNTAEVVTSRAVATPGLIYIRREHRGASAARNAGAAKASGDVLHFFDADNVLLPEFYLHLVTVLDSNPGCGAVCCQRFYRHNDSTRPYEADRCWARELPLGRAMEIDNPFDTSLTLVRRAVFNELGGFNEAFPIVQDVEFAYRLLAHAPAEVTPERHVAYRLHAGGLANTAVGRHIERLLQAEAVAATDRNAYGAMVDTYLQYWIAVLFDQVGRLDEAEARLARLFRASSAHPAGRLLEVHVHLKRGRTNEAARAAEELYAFFPDCGQVVAALARVRAVQDQTDDAVCLLRRAIALEQDELDRQRHTLDLAGILSRSGETEQAVALFANVLDETEAPDVRPRALAGLALVHIMSRSPSAGERVLEGERNAATALRARYVVASGLKQAGLLDEAIAAFELVASSPLAEREGLAPGTQYHLGSLHAAGGDHDRASACFEACLRLNPQHRRAAEMLEALQQRPRGRS